MRLELNNILKVKKADIKLGGLTVLTGVNDSGKSTVGKVLFTILKAANNVRLIDRDRSIRLISSHLRLINSVLLRNGLIEVPLLKDTTSLSIDLIDKNLSFNEFNRNINQEIQKHNFPTRIDVILKDSLKAIQRCISEYDTPNLALKREFESISRSEFQEPLVSYSTENSSINFIENDSDLSHGSFSLGFRNGELSSLEQTGVFSISDVTYIESPVYLHILNSLRRTGIVQDTLFSSNENIPLHLSDMAEKIMSGSDDFYDELFSDYYRTKHITDEIRSIIDGDFSVDRQTEQLNFIRKGTQIPTLSVASGIKSFGVLLRLIRTGNISTSRMLVLDEPEIHLHPEWQVNFCKLIVEMVAAGIPIVVSSHSPYFIQGLRYFAAAKGIEKDVVYYMAEPDADSGLSTFEEVTDDLNRVFSLLAAPLNEIMNVDAIRNRE